MVLLQLNIFFVLQLLLNKNRSKNGLILVESLDFVLISLNEVKHKLFFFVSGE